MARKRTINKKYQQYKKQGLCVRCGGERWEGKTRCQKCHEEHLGYSLNAKNRAIEQGLCRYCCRVPHLENSSMCARCLQSHGVKQKQNYHIHRLASIEAYGGCCACCGMTVEKYLQLDHINNDGAAHRKILSKKTGRGGTSLYTWAYRNGFPDILQLLCANCHQAKTTSGGCQPGDHEAMRNCMNREQQAAEYIKQSGKKTHTSDCATSRAPAEEPGPCDCDASDASDGTL